MTEETPNELAIAKPAPKSRLGFLLGGSASLVAIAIGAIVAFTQANGLMFCPGCAYSGSRETIRTELVGSIFPEGDAKQTASRADGKRNFEPLLLSTTLSDGTLVWLAYTSEPVNERGEPFPIPPGDAELGPERYWRFAVRISTWKPGQSGWRHFDGLMPVTRLPSSEARLAMRAPFDAPVFMVQANSDTIWLVKPVSREGDATGDIEVMPLGQMDLPEDQRLRMPSPFEASPLYRNAKTAIFLMPVGEGEIVLYRLTADGRVERRDKRYDERKLVLPAGVERGERQMRLDAVRGDQALIAVTVKEKREDLPDGSREPGQTSDQPLRSVSASFLCSFEDVTCQIVGEPEISGIQQGTTSPDRPQRPNSIADEFKFTDVGELKSEPMMNFYFANLPQQPYLFGFAPALTEVSDRIVNVLKATVSDRLGGGAVIRRELGNTPMRTLFPLDGVTALEVAKSGDPVLMESTLGEYRRIGSLFAPGGLECLWFAPESIQTMTLPPEGRQTESKTISVFEPTRSTTLAPDDTMLLMPFSGSWGRPFRALLFDAAKFRDEGVIDKVTVLQAQDPNDLCRA